MSTPYAKETTVSAEKSRGEIERELQRFGATGFGYAWQSGYAVVVFEFKERRMKFTLPLPTPDEIKAKKYRRQRRSITQDLDAETRRRWRSLALSIKAKLVTVADGISTVEQEFMAHIVLPNGLTVGEWMTPQIESAYQSGNMPPLLEGPRK